MAALTTFSLIRPLLAGACVLTVTACGDAAPPRADTLGAEVGRYQVVSVAGGNEAIEWDTVTGKSWVLKHYPADEGGGVDGWEPIDDLN